MKMADSGNGIQDFSLEPLAGPLGAEIRGIDLRTINQATFDRLHQLWQHHLLLLFRGQTITPEDLVTLVKRFGTPVSSFPCHATLMRMRRWNMLPVLAGGAGQVADVTPSCSTQPLALTTPAPFFQNL